MAELLTSGELAGIRADVDQIFEDTCLITRPDVNDPPVLNTSTGFYEGGSLITIYQGPCLITPIISRRDRFDEVAQGLVFTRQYRVALPWFEDDVQIRDSYTTLTSDDPQVINRPMLVRDVLVGTNLGYRRLTVQDVRE